MAVIPSEMIEIKQVATDEWTQPVGYAYTVDPESSVVTWSKENGGSGIVSPDSMRFIKDDEPLYYATLRIDGTQCRGAAKFSSGLLSMRKGHVFEMLLSAGKLAEFLDRKEPQWFGFEMHSVRFELEVLPCE